MTSKEMFTDKAKKLFEEWYMRDEYLIDFEHCPLMPSDFYSYPLSMQFGVIEDFAESLGYYIEFGYYKQVYYFIIHNDKGECGGFNTRNEARIECVKVLNNLINNKDE